MLPMSTMQLVLALASLAQADPRTARRYLDLGRTSIRPRRVRADLDRAAAALGLPVPPAQETP